MNNIVIVAPNRTAIGSFGGSLKSINAAVLGSITIKAAIERSGIDPNLIDDVRFGNCFEPVDAFNVARVAALMAGIPDTSAAVTINRVCVSGMEAVISSMAMIQAGMIDIVVAGGVEHMSGVEYVVKDARWGIKFQDTTFIDGIVHGLHCGSHLLPHPETGPVDETKAPLSHFVGKPYIMGHTAEFVAQHYGIKREEMDILALRSNQLAARANNDGSFTDEIVPVEIPRRKKDPIIFNKDEHFRADVTLEGLAKLKPAFIPGSGTVTPGNSSGLNDGSAAMILMTEEKAKEIGVTPMARIKAVGMGGCHPSVMGLSPVPAVENMKKRSGLEISDFDLVEVNEAFAAQYIACERELGLDRDKTNVNGSGIGLGHPVGATGARIMVTLMHALKKQNKTLGLATLCGGGGVAMSIALENI